VEIPSIHLGRAFIGPTFQPRTGTLEGLEHSGALGILQSGELRQTLLAWPGLLAEASEEEQGSLDLINNQMEPVLRKQMDISFLPARYQVLDHGNDQLGPVREEIDLILEQIGESLEG